MSQLILDTTDIAEAINAERNLPPGTYEARLALVAPISQETLDQFHQDLLNAGVDVKGFVQQRANGLWQLSLKYKIHQSSQSISAFGLLIPVIPVVVVGVLVGIALFKMQEVTTLVVVVGVFAVLGLLVAKQPLTEFAKKRM